MKPILQYVSLLWYHWTKALYLHIWDTLEKQFWQCTRLKGAILRAFAQICNVHKFQVDIWILHSLKRPKFNSCIKGTLPLTCTQHFPSKKQSNPQTYRIHSPKASKFIKRSYYILTNVVSFLLLTHLSIKIAKKSVNLSASVLYCHLHLN